MYTFRPEVVGQPSPSTGEVLTIELSYGYSWPEHVCILLPDTMMQIVIPLLLGAEASQTLCLKLFLDGCCLGLADLSPSEHVVNDL